MPEFFASASKYFKSPDETVNESGSKAEVEDELDESKRRERTQRAALYVDLAKEAQRYFFGNVFLPFHCSTRLNLGVPEISI